MTLKKDPNFEEKLTLCLKSYKRNLGNINPSSGKSEYLHFDGLFCRKYVMFELKKTKESCREK